MDRPTAPKYFWEYFFRSAYFGEFRFRGLKLVEQLIVVCAMTGMALGRAGLVDEWRNPSRRSVPLLVTGGLLIAAALAYRLEAAFAPSQDFRYVTLLALPVAGLWM